MSSHINKKSYNFSFMDVFERIASVTDMSNQHEIGYLVGVSQAAVSKRKKDDTWPIEWAYIVAAEYGLLTEWVLTGKGPMRLGETIEEKYSMPFLQEVEEWLEGLVAAHPGRKTWFIVEFEDKFPMFREWKKRKDQAQGKSNSTPGRNVA